MQGPYNTHITYILQYFYFILLNTFHMEWTYQNVCSFGRQWPKKTISLYTRLLLLKPTPVIGLPWKPESTIVTSSVDITIIFQQSIGDMVVILKIMTFKCIVHSGNLHTWDFALSSYNAFDDMLKLIQVMAWCHQAASPYLSHCWPWSMWPYGTTRSLSDNFLCPMYIQ